MDTPVEQTAASSVMTPVDPLEAQVQAAQEEIEQAITRAGLLRDPYRHPLRALVTVLGVFPALVRRLDRLLDRAQNPLDDKTRALFVEAAAKEMPYALKSAAGPFLAEEVRKAAKRWAWEYVAFLLLAFAVGAVVMWRADRWIGEIEAKRIEGAAFMTQIAEENDASTLRDYCYAHPTQQGANWWRCSLPDVWVVAPPGQSKRAAAK
jgi:hypothetical protein